MNNRVLRVRVAEAQPRGHEGPIAGRFVILSDGDEWVSPARDIGRYVAVSRRHLRSRRAAFRWVAGGLTLELAFTAAVWGLALWGGYRTLALWAACLSLGMYAVNVGLMDLP